MRVEAPIKVDRKTKRLAKRLTGGEIAVINHKDIDEVAANSLVEGKIKLVINASQSISGRYPNKGPGILVDKNILIVDNIGEGLFNDLEEGQVIEVVDGKIYRDGKLLGQGEILDKNVVDNKIKLAYENLSVELDRFIDNTIDYAKKEKGFILGEVEIPEVNTDYKNRHVLIVVRGQDYKQDLSTIISYIEEMKPILVGVDGGADALLEFGYTPDVIVGDMDSVSDEALKKAKEIVVHAYTDGRAPGLKRVQDLGLDAIVFPAPGTSEDIAMLTAYEYKAELIVAVGTHSNMIDFLEKGRPGMASTFLVRLKIGSKLIDAKGVNLLYRSKLKLKYIWALIATALFPVFILASFSPSVQQFMHLMQLKIRLLLQM
ncbi:putative cytokinetic ring protein SteA [Paraclostridium sordellii]|uniref:Pyrophosphokinase n=1 Tax=Paraclostridium sordellii TaxID=1505 RepID=A0A0C7PR90_PARSO|nr:putative cytokinetic ring protein SteA [Paeniclostridium sordellii]MCR1850034.1 putative cytokinetic ring protein SteA [Paeniclostridium sordellii]MDU6114066.1 putative cytokinetic ring protein SteA [Paeniclostridium sordellii]CEN79896.1 pyrophosphokinase [[Clostridium] sordellii] [Paeniclostridium sordellii]CEO12711.1 pyrophosphokinase [[Clostridium] sordellii] [Paeniclostridium sordellii]CEP81704.1 pyrophosphokinase [[Clostridium] sordellii] [Paeniclostridium sordellii]